MSSRELASQVVDLHSEPRKRPPPARPNAFEPDGIYHDVTFTNGADRALVASKFYETMEQVFCTQ